ncbi:uncharacterized protein LOC134834521 [Culicoides brevitarsis]|uniref:uncharacterized protein LOC134834521 n=1 Tax=Culicoides brevitarsis TaxID=469753 RepID=UPI00307C57B2
MENIEEITKMLPNVTLNDDECSIGNLPEEVLIEIMDKLDCSSRISVTRTCKNWQNIMLTDSRFAKYHQLTLDSGCVLEMDLEPVSLFMHSPRKFGILRLGDVKIGPDLEPFWLKLAETVRHLIVKEFSPYSIRSYYLAEIIAKFHRLRVLEIETYHVDREIIRIEKKLPPYLHKWPSVEILKLGDAKFEPENYDFLDIMMPRLSDIFLGKFYFSDDFLKKYSTKIRSLDSGDHFGTYFLKKLTNLTHLEVAVDAPTEDLIQYVTNHATLQSLAVTSQVFPAEQIPKLHKLTLDLAIVVNSFAPLRLCPELRELHVKLSNYDSKCFFGHEIIACPNLETLSLCNFSSGDCQKCQQYMFESFPNLKSFATESCFVSSADVVELISKYSTRLEHLTSKYFVTENFCLNDSLLKWAMMPNLKTCCLNPVGMVTEAGIEKFCESCPMLEDLQLFGTTNFNAAMFDIVVGKLKRLRYLNIEQRRPVHEITPPGISFKITRPNGRPVYCYRFF